MINLTVGVNIYNVQKYLQECLDSVIAQQGDDIEILLIDDGSTDSSGEICDEYARKDQRISVVHQKNIGIGLARNVILERAKGKWITFVDADDSLTHDAIDKMRPYFESEENLIVFLEESKGVKQDLSLMKVVKKSNMEESIAGIRNSNNPYCLCNAWGRIFRKDFLRQNNLSFRNLKRGEDLIFMIETMYCLNTVLLVPMIVYKYRLSPEGVTRRFDFGVVLAANDFVKTLHDLFESHEGFKNEAITKIYYTDCFQQLRVLLNLVPYHKDCHWNRRQRIAFLNQLLDYHWVQQCIQHQEHLQPKFRLEKFCEYGMQGKTCSIDNYYYIRKIYGLHFKFLHSLWKAFKHK